MIRHLPLSAWIGIAFALAGAAAAAWFFWPSFRKREMPETEYEIDWKPRPDSRKSGPR